MKIYAMTTIQEIITTRIHQMKLYLEFPEGNIQHARGRRGRGQGGPQGESSLLFQVCQLPSGR